MSVYIFVVFSVTIASILSKLKYSSNNEYNIKDFYSQKKYNLFFMIITWLILSLVSGLRWRVGSDYWQYSANYNSYKEIPWNQFSLFNEPGIKIISKIVSHIYDDYAGMFFIASMLTIFLIVKTIYKNSSMLTFSLILFIFIGGWHGSFNAVRQYLAASIIFAGHKYVLQRKFWKYVVIVGIASLFHISAIVFLFLYFVPKKRMKKKYIVMMLVFVAVFMASYDAMINFAGFLKDETITINSYIVEEVSMLRVLTKVIPIFFYFLFTQKENRSEKENFYVNIMFINAAIVVATSNSAYLSRIWMYTDLFAVLSYPVILEIKDKRYKNIITLLILFFYFIYWFYEISITPNLYNFNWIFER